MTADIQVAGDGLRRGLEPAAMPFGHSSIAAMVANLPHSDEIALKDAFGTLSYSKLSERIAKACAVLSDFGVSRGTIVAASAPNHSDLVVAFLAAQCMGAVWLGFNRTLVTAEKVNLLVDSGAEILICDDVVATALEMERERAPKVRAILTTHHADASFAKAIDAAAPLSIAFDAVDPHAPAGLTYTSGTTGQPKGAVHSQHSIMAFVNAAASLETGAWAPRLRRSLAVSMTILNCMIYGPVLALATGGSFVSVARVDAASIGYAIDSDRIEMINCAPTTVHDLFMNPDLAHFSLASLKALAAGGAAVSGTLREAVRSRLRIELFEDYGMTESPCGVAWGAGEVPGALTYAYPHVAIAIMDDGGREVAPGHVGELCVGPTGSGPWKDVYTGLLGYRGLPDVTRATFFGRWLRTGDMASRSPEGAVTIVGRKKEMIIRGGANIYPVEIEQILRRDNRIAEAMVTALPDARLGEVVAAYLKLAEGVAADAALKASLIKLCGSELARYKIPEHWIVIDTVPRNAMNKPIKAELANTPQLRL
ncbi:MAG: class I adenylate-forming enzyme family protein [Caulobacterales bacterium]